MSVISSTVASREDSSSPQFQELDQVLSSAQLRRTAELGGWLKHYFESRRQAWLRKQANLTTTVITQPVTG
jgi:hypothetical protein